MAIVTLVFVETTRADEKGEGRGAPEEAGEAKEAAGAVRLLPQHGQRNKCKESYRGGRLENGTIIIVAKIFLTN